LWHRVCLEGESHDRSGHPTEAKSVPIA
jgi:hypothetical protein